MVLLQLSGSDDPFSLLSPQRRSIPFRQHRIELQVKRERKSGWWMCNPVPTVNGCLIFFKLYNLQWSLPHLDTITHISKCSLPHTTWHLSWGNSYTSIAVCETVLAFRLFHSHNNWGKFEKKKENSVGRGNSELAKTRECCVHGHFVSSVFFDYFFSSLHWTQREPHLLDPLETKKTKPLRSRLFPIRFENSPLGRMTAEERGGCSGAEGPWRRWESTTLIPQNVEWNPVGPTLSTVYCWFPN